MSHWNVFKRFNLSIITVYFCGIYQAENIFFKFILVKCCFKKKIHSFAGEDRPRENITSTADGQAVVGGAAAESGTGKQRLRCCVRVTAVQVRKAIWGVAMVICVCTSWAGSTQLAKLTFKQYDAPFTLTWFATSWNCLFFPLYYIGHLCKGPEKQSPKQRIR